MLIQIAENNEYLVGIKAHSECRRQRVLNRNKAHLDVRVDKRRYNRNWCTGDSLSVEH
jgi:hypothetical protein